MPQIVFVGRMGWLVANTRLKRKKNFETTLKGPINVKNENFEKRKKTFFPQCLKNTFSKNQVAGSKTVTCSVLTDKQTNRQTKKQRQRQPFQGFRSSSLQSIIEERSNIRDTTQLILLLNIDTTSIILCCPVIVCIQ